MADNDSEPLFYKEMGLNVHYLSKTGRRMQRRVTVKVVVDRWLGSPALYLAPADAEAARYVPQLMTLYAWSTEPQAMRELGTALLRATGAARGA